MIPCLNEAPCIAQLVRRIQGVLPGVSILVCDNGSTDGTAQLARQAGANVITEPIRGKGRAVRALFEASGGDICVLMDGDLTYDVGALPRLVNQFEQEKLDFLNVARLAVDKNCYPFGRELGNKIFNWLTGRLCKVPVKDILSGYKLFSRRFIEHYRVQANGFEVETELVLATVRLNLQVAETSAPYYARKQNNPSKLHLFKDGLRILNQLRKNLK